MDYAFERNNRLIAMAVTIVSAILLFILFLLIKFITPIPPFEESKIGGLEVNFGFDVVGIGENNSLQPVAEKIQATTKISSQPVSSTPSEMLSTDEPSEVVIPPVKHKHKDVKKEKPIIVEEKPKPDKNLMDVLDRVNSKTGTNSGDGNTNTPGNQGDVNGTLKSNVYSDFGGGSGGIHGRLRGSGRKMIGDVGIRDDSQETGIVAVEILVDRYGKIIKAEPILIGSTTTSSHLWKKAKDGLINKVLFNQSPTGEEARGTMYINFTVR